MTMQCMVMMVSICLTEKALKKHFHDDFILERYKDGK